MKELLEDFVRGFEALYFNDDIARIKVMTANIHGLLHLAENIKDCGPAWAFAQWGMERTLRELKPLASSKVEMNVSLFNGAIIREQLNHVQYLGAGFDAVQLARPSDVNEVTATRGTLLGGEKLYTPNRNQRQALRAFYTMLIGGPIDAIAATAFDEYNRYDSDLFSVYPRYERYGVVYGSDLSQRKGDVTRASNLICFKEMIADGRRGETLRLRYGRVRFFLPNNDTGLLLYVTRFPPANHEDAEDGTGNRIVTINAVEGPDVLVSEQDILYLIGILTDNNPPSPQGHSRNENRQRHANRFIVSRNFGGITSADQMRDRYL
jgi:hypothetical protein